MPSLNPQLSTLDKPSFGLGIDWSHPLSRGLGAVWLLNEGAGTLANDLLGRVPAAPDDRMWFGGGGLRCSGSNYASFAHDPRVFTGDAVSVFASIIPTDLSGTHDDRSVFTKGDGPFTVYLALGGAKVSVFTNGNNTWLDGTGPVPLNVRSVVGVTRGPDGRKLWLKGVLDTSDGVNNALNWGAAGGRIGHRQDNANATTQFAGLIEWVAFWNRGLSPAEVGLVSREFYSLFLPMRLGGSLALQGGASPLFRRTEVIRAGSRVSGPG